MILEVLEEVSGLKVNLNKCLLVGMNMKERALERAAFIMGCQIGTLSISFLGLPLPSKVLHCKDWNAKVCV